MKQFSGNSTTDNAATIALLSNYPQSTKYPKTQDAFSIISYVSASCLTFDDYVVVLLRLEFQIVH